MWCTMNGDGFTVGSLYIVAWVYTNCNIMLNALSEHKPIDCNTVLYISHTVANTIETPSNNRWY